MILFFAYIFSHHYCIEIMINGAEANSFFFLVLKANPISLQYLTVRKSGAKTDVRVDVRPHIIQVEREHPRVGRVTPVATA